MLIEEANYVVEIPTACLANPADPEDVSLTKETLAWFVNDSENSLGWHHYGCLSWTENGATTRYFRFALSRMLMRFLLWRTTKGDASVMQLPAACVETEYVRAELSCYDHYNYSLPSNMVDWLSKNAPGYKFWITTLFERESNGPDFYLKFTDPKHYVIFKLLWWKSEPS